jgi:hypothetical protein
MTRKARRKRSKAVSASDLAQMGVCERLVLFEHHYGKRSTASQRAAIRRGLTEHKRFYLDGVSLSEKKGPCCVATLVFGQGSETTALKAFRNRVLRPYPTGRWLIGVYYRTAPEICALLKRRPWLQPVVRAILRPIAWMVYRMPRSNRRDHVT